ncbi:MAG: MFS transporter [Maricaulis sp.]|uniref:MFS transporter n=1 Tax=Maricaulis sp. TaxID=1486257 RepID=UPI001B0D76AC|nr:MFS transporter [Maricaulis sp.]MBO6847008.1 MFS transporter [Maricaulis sp.]MBO6876367.1 MFS transporter [Maricaulis sp.]MDM7984197.1 MFS transporter [Maricaulis sp.]
MTESTATTRPEDRISIFHRLIYGSGAFANNLLAGSIGAMMVVLNIGLGMDPVLVGLLGGLPRFFDAITDPIVGYISDRTRTKWGRRRPFIFFGAIAAAISFAMLWQFPAGQSEMFYFWYFLIGSFIFFLAYTLFATPWVALGYELTPDYDQRNLLMGTQNFIAQMAYFIPPWLVLWAQNDMFDNMVQGTAVIAWVLAGLVAFFGILPAIFLRERMAEVAAKELDETKDQRLGIIGNVWDFMKGFGTALSFVPFLKLCAATFLVFNGFIMIAAFQFYVVAYYIFAGDLEAGAAHNGAVDSLRILFSFVAVAAVAWFATRIGKRKMFGIAIGLAALGYGLKWFLYNPEAPWLLYFAAPLMAFGLGGLFTLMPSMVADVVDMDEVRSHQRREGMFASIFWWVVKLGQGMATAMGGFLLASTGFDQALGGDQAESTLFWLRVWDVTIPVVFYLVAIWLVTTLDISREKAAEVRKILEARRGTTAAADSTSNN